ncbi:MAG: DUF3089 domain-containing protein [Bacteroidetes bacterium]|jgi:hypothetical protein|nr:DUF3089 domain-containing protein [Bacteroidota bacterium]
MKQSTFGYILLVLFASCKAIVLPTGTFSETNLPAEPDYSKPANWAALPTIEDFADLTPDTTFMQDLQSISEADVFFLHPTTYVGDKGEDQWNASCDDEVCNEKTEEGAIRYQASIFNGAGRVYAPRYRQAHLQIFYHEELKDRGADKAYRLAYQDIKAAFEYYLKNYNMGRPIIIASHSQGSGHGKTLLKDFFDGKPLQKQLVAAYLVGWPIEENFFKNIKGCKSAKEIGCFCSWRTFKKGYKPEKFWEPNNNIVVTNPLNWVTDESLAPKSLNKGAVFYNFNKIYKQAIQAQVYDGILWTNKPKFPGSFFLTKKNYHIADYNFFYVNVRENAQLRVASYLKEEGTEKESLKSIDSLNN